MAYSIAYLVDMKGADFNRLLKDSDRASDSYLDEMKIEGPDLWDARLPNDPSEFLVDLTGEWTLCILPYPYSWLLRDVKDDDVFRKIEEWERALQNLLPSTKIVRVDDYLLDQWNSRYDYLLIRNQDAVQDFLSWLQTQDSQHWSVLSGKS